MTPSKTEQAADQATEESAGGDAANIEPVNVKTASVSPPLSRDGEAKVELDLRDLVADGSLAELIPGGAINVIGEASDLYNLAGQHLTRGEVFRLEVVTPDQLLARLERNELALRSRLEQTIDETRNLRETLNLLRRGFDENESGLDATEVTRQQQIRRLRVQQSGLQASKTSDELSGIAESLDDILREMVNNRVDSVDRQERIGEGVRDPLRLIVAQPLRKLRDEIVDIERSVADSGDAMAKTAAAVATADEVIARLTEVLDKMLDLESYNEILDIVRELIEDQDELLKDTKDERKKRVLNLFD